MTGIADTDASTDFNPLALYTDTETTAHCASLSLRVELPVFRIQGCYFAILAEYKTETLAFEQVFAVYEVTSEGAFTGGLQFWTPANEVEPLTLTTHALPSQIVSQFDPTAAQLAGMVRACNRSIRTPEPQLNSATDTLVSTLTDHGILHTTDWAELATMVAEQLSKSPADV